MKNTAKNRALIYIREKNHLRWGGKLVQYFKVSGEMSGDYEFIQHQISKFIDNTKKYKMPLDHLDEMAQDGDDFVYNLFTVRITSTRQ